MHKSCHFDNLNAIERTRNQCNSLTRKNSKYGLLMNYLKKATLVDDEEPNFINLINMNKIYIPDSDLNMVYSYIDGAIGDAAILPNSIRSFPIPIVEIPSKYHRLSIQISVIDSAIINEYFWNLNNLNRCGIKKIIEHAAKGLSKYMEEDMGKINMVYFTKASDNNLIIKINFPNVIVNLYNKVKIIKKIQERLNKKCKKSKVTVDYFKYNQIGACSSYVNEIAWTYNGAYSLDIVDEYLEEKNLVDFTTIIPQSEIPFYNSDIFSINVHSKTVVNKDFTLIDGDEIESELDNFEYEKLLINNDEARCLDIICRYLPEEFRNNKDELILMIRSFNNKIQIKPVFIKYGIEYGLSIDDVNKAWEDKSFDKINISYYFRLVMIYYNFGNNLVKNKFENEYSQFMKNLLRKTLDENDGVINHTNWGNIVKYVIFGRYITRQVSARKFEWYKFMTHYDNPEYKQLYKWNMTEFEPNEINHILNDYIAGLLKEISIELAEDGSDKNTNSLIKKITTIKNNLGNIPTQNNINTRLASNCTFNAIKNHIDNDGHVIGVLNGVLDLDLNSENPQPRLCNVYSKYFVSKCANSSYIPYNKNNKYVKIWKKVFRDIIVEKDARDYKLYRTSTMLDTCAKSMKILTNVAGGFNAKSTFSDNTVHALGDYAGKFSSNLIFGKPKPGAADPELMQTKGKRGGIITETDSTDKLKGSRIKTLSERVKTARALFENVENFEAQLTIDVYSNYIAMVEDDDFGLWRRLEVYWFKTKFVKNNPNAANNELLADPIYEDLAMVNQEACDALFSILVHYRVKLQKKYKGNLDNVPCETIKRETEEFRTSQDKITKFIMTKVVSLYGYNLSGSRDKSVSEDDIRDYYSEGSYVYQPFITCNTLLKAYKEWYREFNGGKKIEEDFDSLNKKFINSKLGRFIDQSNGTVNGIRILPDGLIKKKGESFIV